MRPPQLWVLAGGNGAGKTTFYRQFLEPRGVLFANADEVARQIDPRHPERASYAASQIVEHLREQLVRERKSFCFETVFSHPSKISFLADAKAAGYEVVLVVVHLELDSLNQARVQQRVREGGHAVPPEKIVSRIPRTLENLRKALPLCDRVIVLDNSRADAPYHRIAVINQHTLTERAEPLPPWARELLADYLAETDRL